MISELQSYMSDNGYPAENIVLDNKFHRFGEKKNFWLIGKSLASYTQPGRELVFACFGNWKTGDSLKYMPKNKVSNEDKKIIKEEMQKLQKEIAVEREREKEEAAKRSITEFNSSIGTWLTEYQKRKKIKHWGTVPLVKGEKGNCLIVPIRNIKGEIRNLQRIFDDGEKRFMFGAEKRSCFHALRGDVLSAEVILIAEGFSTAATIAEATADEICVVSAMDAGNLLSVGQEIRRANNGAQIIFMADNDENKIGEQKANDAAKAIEGIVCLCPVSTDFNDLGAEKTREHLKEILTKKEGVGTSVIPLGRIGRDYYVYSTNIKDVLIFKGSDKKTFFELAPESYWWTKYPGTKNSIDWDLATNDIIQQGASAGIYKPDHVRGSGVWRDNGEIIVHLGNRLWSKDKGEFPLYSKENKYFYCLEESLKSIHPNPFTHKDLEPLRILSENLPVENTYDGKLLCGWIVAALLGGLLEWRPHSWLTGGAGSGKSTVLKNLIQHLTGEYALAFKGNTSEAALRRETQKRSLLVLFDEFESMNITDAKAVASCLGLMRQASSNAAGKIVKASGDSGSVSYNPRFSAAVVSIKLDLDLEQDKSRFLVVNFIKRDNWTEVSKLFEAIASEEWADRFRSMVFRNAPTFLESLEIFKSVIPGSQRFKDQYAPLLAGCRLIDAEGPPSISEAKDYVDFWLERDPETGDIGKPIETEDEAKSCLEYLLSCVIETKNNKTTIGACIGYTREDSVEHQEALHNIGIHYSSKRGAIHVRKSSHELVKIFRGHEKWKNWSQLFARLPGSEKNCVASYGKSGSHKGTFVNVTNF